MSDYFLGEIRLFSFPFAPQDWHFCDGASMQISQSTALYSLLGVQFGGDGRTTFNLPDLRGRTPVHVNQGGVAPAINTGPQGNKAGVDSYTLAPGEAADHLHAVGGTSDNAGHTRFATATGAFVPATAVAAPGSKVPVISVYAPPTQTSDYVALAPGMTVPLGAAVPHENRQPYLAANYCISTSGLYPSRP